MSLSSAECLFSAIKFLKPRIRSTLIDDSLITGPGLMYIHKNIESDLKVVVDVSSLLTRKSNFVM